MSDHTPTPWYVIPSIHGDQYQCVQIGEDDIYSTLEMLPADARRIVAAVNACEGISAEELESTPLPDLRRQRDEAVRLLREMVQLAVPADYLFFDQRDAARAFLATLPTGTATGEDAHG